MWVAIATTLYHDDVPKHQVVFGPFRTQPAADAYARQIRNDFSFIRTVKLHKPLENPPIHPNQAEISDYIDPSVAN
jgi:hypothetical protein